MTASTRVFDGTSQFFVGTVKLNNQNKTFAFILEKNKIRKPEQEGYFLTRHNLS